MNTLRNLIGTKVNILFALLLLPLVGCAAQTEIPNLKSGSSMSLSNAKTIAYLNSVKWNAGGPGDACEFKPEGVEFMASGEQAGPFTHSYGLLELANLSMWQNIGRSGLWIRFENDNPVVSFFDIQGCKVLDGTASQEDLTKVAESLISLGATYKPAE